MTTTAEPERAAPRGSQSRSVGTLRILRVADVAPRATAGMSGYMLRSGAEMTGRGHRVAFWFRDDLRPGLTIPGLRRLLVPWLIAAKVLLAAARDERYDIVEIHEPLAAPYATLSRLLARRLPPCVVVSYGLEERAWRAQRAHLRVYGRRSSRRSRLLVPLTLLSQSRLAVLMSEAILVPSTADRDFLIDALGLPAERVSCAYTGVSEELFAVASSTVRGPGVRFLFLGTWIERKGSLELTEAWRRLADAHPDAFLTLAGVGDAQAARRDTATLPRVDVIDDISREELPRLLAEHDVFVLPSWFEGLPLSMLEAAAAGLACVVCSVCGNLDVFRPDDPHRDGAILVPPSDVNALHRALVMLATDGRLRETLGARARARARHFSWARTADQSLTAYHAAVLRRAGPAAR